jgi:hypothetical protein
MGTPFPGRHRQKRRLAKFGLGGAEAPAEHVACLAPHGQLGRPEVLVQRPGLLPAVAAAEATPRQSTLHRGRVVGPPFGSRSSSASGQLRSHAPLGISRRPPLLRRVARAPVDSRTVGLRACLPHRRRSGRCRYRQAMIQPEARPQPDDRHVGRYGARLAAELIAAVDVAPGQRALDVGCGSARSRSSWRASSVRPASPPLTRRKTP